MPRLFDWPNYARPWTPEEFTKLTALLGAGETIPDIAKEMGRSQEAVRNKAWKIGLLKPRSRKA